MVKAEKKSAMTEGVASKWTLVMRMMRVRAGSWKANMVAMGWGGVVRVMGCGCGDFRS